MVELSVDSGPAQVMVALRRLDEGKMVPATMTLREPSLDDVFLSLTGRRAEQELLEEA